MFEVLGKLTWLWMSSPLHREWPIELASNFLLPPIQLQQYLLLERDGLPVAYCSWAFLNKEAEMQYFIDPSHINLANWNQGENLWFVDWIAPYSKHDSFELRSILKKKFDSDIARAIRVKKNKTTARVMEFKGANVDPTDARNKLDESYKEFLSNFKSKQ
jgi:cytolysin-activating lysine-acyltransferase